MRLIKAHYKPRGGIHPSYNKHLTADQPTQTISLPPSLYVSMAQHLGAPAKPLVKKGDTLTPGKLIGSAEGFVSAAVHAPAAGQVRAVEQYPGPAGRPVTTVVIDTTPTEATSEAPMPPITEWRKVDKATLRERVSAAGIVGMGGAGFPTHVKLSPPPGKTIDTLIINGAECEPYLSADYRLMLEQPAAVWCGAEIIAAILGVQHVVVAIEDNKPNAIRAMEEAMRGAPDSVELAQLPTHYPQGAEKQQIYAITGREVPSGKLPMDVGALVENVGTCMAICEAVTLGKPLTERLLTVTGSLIKRPLNLRAPIGTPFQDLVDFCGGLRGTPGKIVCGGPMMGLAQYTLDTATTKTTSGLLLLKRDQVSQFTSTPCISCGRCVAACPMGLMPCDLSECAENEDYDGAEKSHVLDCIECGSCAHECPAHRPLVQQLRRAKAEVTARRRARTAAQSGA